VGGGEGGDIKEAKITSVHTTLRRTHIHNFQLKYFFNIIIVAIIKSSSNHNTKENKNMSLQHNGCNKERVKIHS
jgi:hypothetical protein